MMDVDEEWSKPENRKKVKRKLAALKGWETRRKRKQEKRDKWRQRMEDWRRSIREERAEEEARRILQYQEYVRRSEAASKGWATRRKKAMDELISKHQDTIETEKHNIDMRHGGNFHAPIEVVNQFLAQFVTSYGERIMLDEDEIAKRREMQAIKNVHSDNLNLEDSIGEDCCEEDDDDAWATDESWLKRISSVY